MYFRRSIHFTHYFLQLYFCRKRGSKPAFLYKYIFYQPVGYFWISSDIKTGYEFSAFFQYTVNFSERFFLVGKSVETVYSLCNNIIIDILPVGAYWYTYATTADEAKQEASVCLRTLSGKSFEYPVAFDIEEKAGLFRASELCNAFCSELEKSGYYAAVYSFKSAFESNIIDIKEKYDTFLSHIGVEQTDYSGDYGLWQYSWMGRIDGISGDVDLDYAYKDYPTIIKSAGLNGFSHSDTQGSMSEKNTLEQILDHVASINKKIN